ncbi:hypothetical protein V3C99_017042 [Haemonchus contortus]|uniref:Uncharacterized protein n=1 Tax=Haemonchus contortus TaxID=6289 RepID=A0A7I4Z0Q5_HAECO
MCVLYFSRPGPPIPHLTRSLQAELKELRNFVTDIQTDGQTDRLSALYKEVHICIHSNVTFNSSNQMYGRKEAALRQAVTMPFAEQYV